jgi:hypothetical protein
MKKSSMVSPWVKCPTCYAPIVFNEIQIREYYKGEKIVTCTQGHTADWWNLVRQTIEDNFMDNQAYTLIGAETKVFIICLRKGQEYRYRFSDYDIPHDAKILYINYTPQGTGLFPVEFHGNVSTRRRVGDEVVVYPFPMKLDSSTSNQTDTKVAVMVSWVAGDTEDGSLYNLREAFEFYVQNKYSSIIIPANVAVELALGRFLTSYLQNFSSKTKVGKFIEEVTYAHQLNVLLTMIAKTKGLPVLPDQIRGVLNKLRSDRNYVAHCGKLKKPLEKNEAAELLCGSLFGLHYVRYLSEQLLGVHH